MVNSLGKSAESKTRQKLNIILIIYIASLFLGFGYRALLVNHTHSQLAGCKWCFIAPVLTHDLLILSIILIIISLSFTLKTQTLKILAGLTLTLITLMFWVDTITYKTLNYRVYLNDIFLFSKETKAIWTFIKALKSTSQGLFIIILSTISFCSSIAFIWYTRKNTHASKLTFFPGLITLALYTSINLEPDYIFNDTVKNFIEINKPSGAEKNYSQKLNENHKETSKIIEAKETNKYTNNRNIIILVIESFSAYHLNSLINRTDQYTPFIEKIAKNNTYFSNFFANGFTTDGGLISLMTGRTPIPSIGRYRSVDAFQGFDCIEDSFPIFMKSQGHETLFFSNGSLEFTNLGGWAKSIGFDYIEGPDYPFYQNFEKGLFGSVEDKALFLRVINWMDQRKTSSTQPFSAVLMTHSTHPPFIDPSTKSNIEVNVYQYMDSAVNSFYTELKERNYFSNGGILLITGDHRAYTPISLIEHKTFGESARARIPLVVIGDANLPKGEIKTYAQQVDLLNSIKHLFNQPSLKIPANRGLFLNQPTVEPSFILHASGKDRDQIKVYYPNGKDSRIRLDGDETAWDGRSPDNKVDILNMIARDRISRGNATINYVDYLYNVTFDPNYGKEKFASGSSCKTMYPYPGY